MRPRQCAVCLLLCFGLLCPAPAQGKGEQRLVIPGTGDSQLLLRDLAGAFMRANPGVLVLVPDSIGSSGGRKAVLDGKAKLGRVANSSPEKEARSGLSYHLFASTPVVFAVNPSVSGVDDISPQQLLGIYSGAVVDWSELGGAPGKIYPLAREEGDSSLTVISRSIPGFRTFDATISKIFYTTPEALAALEEHKGTIAYGPLAMFASGDARILSLSGREPDPTGCREDGYPLCMPLGLVWVGEIDPLAQSFIMFIGGSQAARIIGNHSCMPSGGNP